MRNLAFIDIEATSADARRADIIEIAFIVKNHDNEIVDHFHSLIKPASTIPPEITELTGISEQMVENAPEFHAVAEKVRDKLNGATLVAHKAQFDRDILCSRFSELGLSFSGKSICTLELSKRIAPGMSSYSLSALCSFFGIPLKKNHRAMDDAEAAENLYRILSLLSGETHKKETYLPAHKKAIDKARTIPGLVTLRNKDGRPFYRKAVENIQKHLKESLELTVSNKAIIASCREIEIKETGSLARALLLLATKEKPPVWSIYSFLDKRGEVIVRCGKVNPKKKALLYFQSKREALQALRRIQKASQTQKSYAYRESPDLDKSEIVKKNATLKEQIRRMKPELDNLLIRSKRKIDGRYKYVVVRDNDRFALFDHEEELEKALTFPWSSLKYKKLGPSSQRALERSVKFTKNQRSKTDVVVKLKRDLGDFPEV